MYFTATSSLQGNELWITDGTGAGTVMVKDIKTGIGGSNPGNFINLNGTLYFTADDGINGAELWKSDGTGTGTVMVKDIYTGQYGSMIQHLTNLNGVLYFNAADDTNGRELWMTDGTEAGTVMVKDIRTGGSTQSGSPGPITVYNGLMYFSAGEATGVHDRSARAGALGGLASPLTSSSSQPRASTSSRSRRESIDRVHSPPTP